MRWQPFLALALSGSALSAFAAEPHDDWWLLNGSTRYCVKAEAVLRGTPEAYVAIRGCTLVKTHHPAVWFLDAVLSRRSC